MSMVNDVLKDLQGEMDKTLESFKRDLTKIRTGRANLNILDGVRVEYYGTATPLNQVASLQVADARLIVIKPWDKAMVPVIDKAVRAANLGINPASDADVVRLPIPPLTEERRKDLVKQVRKLAEEAKVALRGHRREANQMLQELMDSGDVAEDDAVKGQTKVQEATDASVAKIDEILGKKEKEILEV